MNINTEISQIVEDDLQIEKRRKQISDSQRIISSIDGRIGSWKEKAIAFITAAAIAGSIGYAIYSSKDNKYDNKINNKYNISIQKEENNMYNNP